MNLIFNQPSKINFSITIAGTQTRPSEVRVILGDSTKLSFPASTDDGHNYFSILTPLRDVVSSLCQLSIEVQFGEKVFVPIRRQIQISDDRVPVEVQIQQSQNHVTVQNTEVDEPAIDNTPIEITPTVTPASHNNEVYKARYESLITEILSAPKTAPKVSNIEIAPIGPAPDLLKLKKTSATKKTIPTFESTVTGIDVDPKNVAKSIFTESIDQKKQTYIPRKPKKVVESDTTIAPFQIIKEDVFYK